MNNNNATDPGTMLDIMEKKYGARTQTNMRARKRRSDPPLKLRIHPKINSKRPKILHANVMVQNMGNTHLDLRIYARIHATIHYGLNQQYTVMCNPLITTIFTQYHVSKVLNVFGDTGVAAVLKEIKQLQGRMAMNKKTADKMTTSKKRQCSNI